jgi:hypothetical protein
MGHLDRRVAREEDDGQERQRATQQQIAYERQLREAAAEAARTAAQENLEAEVYELLSEFMELMEARDYPHLETVTLPMTRWWWPFPVNTRKAVWALLFGNSEEPYQYRGHDGYETATVKTVTGVYVIAESGDIVYYKWKKSDSTLNSTPVITFHEWSGEHASAVRADLLKRLGRSS